MSIPPPNMNYAALVIGGSFIIEGASLLVAINAVKRGAAAEGMKMRDYVWRGHDPTSVAVMTEVLITVREGKVKEKGCKEEEEAASSRRRISSGQLKKKKRRHTCLAAWLVLKSLSLSFSLSLSLSKIAVGAWERQLLSSSAAGRGPKSSYCSCTGCALRLAPWLVLRRAFDNYLQHLGPVSTQPKVNQYWVRVEVNLTWEKPDPECFFFLISRTDAIKTDDYDFKMTEVCPAMAVYERPVQMRFVDGSTRIVAIGGGMAMSNPITVTIMHVLNNKRIYL
ncbi:hypothetical protein ACLOJK_036952 [Asimina triloba]